MNSIDNVIFSHSISRSSTRAPSTRPGLPINPYSEVRGTLGRSISSYFHGVNTANTVSATPNPTGVSTSVGSNPKINSDIKAESKSLSSLKSSDVTDPLVADANLVGGLVTSAADNKAFQTPTIGNKVQASDVSNTTNNSLNGILAGALTSGALDPIFAPLGALVGGLIGGLSTSPKTVGTDSGSLPANSSNLTL